MKNASHVVRARDYALDGETGVVLTLSSKVSSELHIDLLQVARQGNGTGSRVLSNLTRYADISGLFLVLSPSSVFGSDPQRLKKWYEDNGFVATGSKEMVRTPQNLA